LFGASTMAGRCVSWMICAAVKVLPEPVTPSSTWSRSPAPMPATSSAMACGWSPAGWKPETISKRLPPSHFSGRGGLCGTQVRPLTSGRPSWISRSSAFTVAVTPEAPISLSMSSAWACSTPMPRRWASALSARVASPARAGCGASAKPGPVPEPRPAVPRLMAGLSSSASAGPSGCSSGRVAFDFGALDLAAPDLAARACLAAAFGGGDVGALGMAAIWARRAGWGRVLLPPC
jgi:hypothetical protein